MIKGVSLTSLLFIILLVLKLTHVIGWGWWWITAPLWIGGILGVLFLVFFLLTLDATLRSTIYRGSPPRKYK